MKVLIVQNQVPHYRSVLFDELSKEFDLSVFTSRTVRYPKINFSKKYSNLFKTAFFNFYLLRHIFKHHYDVVVIGDDLRHIWLLFFRMVLGRIWSVKGWVIWGVGGRSTYGPLGTLKRLMFRANDILLFYDHNSKAEYIARFPSVGARSRVAVNTVSASKFNYLASEENKKLKDNSKSFNIINVGSINERKRNDVLVDVVHDLVKNHGKSIQVYFVGNGPQKLFLSRQIDHLKLSKNVFLYDAIEENSKLLLHYLNSDVCVSYGQIGLTVLQSFAHSVPVITHRNAISGGETSNIIHGFNGFLVDNESDLKEKILLLMNQRKLLDMFKTNARCTFNRNASMSAYVANFKSAIISALQ